MVTSGSAHKNVVKVRASGTDKKHIRYSVSGHTAFKITKKGGRIMYDGSRTESDSVQLTVTARDVTGTASGASLALQVKVIPSGDPNPWPRPVPGQQQCVKGLVLNAGERCFYYKTYLETATRNEVSVNKNGVPRIRHRCWGFARCTVVLKGLSSYTESGFSIEKQSGQWTVTKVP